MPTNTPPKVLVVEDDTVAQIVIKSVFKPFNCLVDFVESAEEGLEKYQKNNYGLFLIDIGLPGKLDGIQMIEIIRKTEAGKELPLIALTAHTQENEQERLEQAQATKLIIKPLTWPVLQGLIHEFLPESVVPAET